MQPTVRVWAVLVAVVSFCLGFSNAFAAVCEPPVAVAVSLQGEVKVRHPESADWKPVARRDAFCPGDAVRVMERSRADLLLANETTLRLDQNTEVHFTAPERAREFWLDVLVGGTYFMSRTPRRFRVETPFVNAGIEGTEFYVRVEEDRAFLTVFEGKVAAENDSGQVAVTRGQSVVAERGRAPEQRIETRSTDAVRWTLFYPPVFAPRRGDPSDWRGRGSELLSLGRFDEAGSVIGEALRDEPNNADALALRAAVAVAQNEREEALSLAGKAVAADAGSAAARLALSYAQQAAFDLEGALSTLQEAVKLEPDNALARARLSELLLSFGRLDEALSEAKKAAADNPDVARTQTVLGFAYLAQIRTEDARAAFEKAIDLDQADPLPHLGLGLATIREGKVEAGRKEIEVAASLDPNDSLLRSYLGKAYYEEKRGDTASTQFSMAKELDPNDPTPYFYDAILKQTRNRPVEALHDLQKSIALNDNRAVYRSRLLLDEDLAARSASLGRIYTDLGFQQLALVEGWKSVNTDPANYSAHRFLADTYAALPRHEIARVSELLQSQLLQPININPVQPSLAQSNLFILEGAGPSSPSFNEFNPLFYRNRFALQGSGVVGNNGTWGEEVVHSAVWNRLSYSLGQFHFETDGFRVNNDLDQDIYNAFVQGSLSYKTSVQGEFRYATRENGDLTLGFDPNDFFPGLRQEMDQKSMRLGIHHAFSPSSRIIASAFYEDNELVDIIAEQIPGLFDVKVKSTFPEQNYSFEIQHLLSGERFNVISGAGWIELDSEMVFDTELIFPPPAPPMTTTEILDSDVQHTNVYLYSQIHYPKHIVWTIGGSADFVKNTADDSSDRDQFNPKFGVVWTPLPGTTFRAAAFRALRRTLVFTGQTIEPTQVAGFNQFFDDAGGTKSWRYGAAVDQRFSETVYGGLEYSQRDLDVPIGISVPPAPPEVRWIESEEQSGRAYLYWTPNRMLALSGEYQYERIENENLLIAGDYTFLRIHRFPLGAALFHPCGFMTRARGTFFKQETDPGSDDFWIFDGAIGYRLPKRLGLVTLEGKNLFDQEFNYRDPDPGDPSIQPERAVFFKITLVM